MADSDRVVFPDEVADEKAKAAEVQGASGAGDSNSVESPEVTATPTPTPTVTTRNMIQAPYNCPEGYTMGADGVCRQVF